jgi:error-prone DNA polymerase
MSGEPLPLLHVHSYYSLGRGCLSPEEICLAARRRGAPAVGLTDTDSFYGLVRFLRAAEREGVKALAGAVLSGRGAAPRSARDADAPTRGRDADAPCGDADTGREACTAYVLDRQGFGRLGAIITAVKAGRPALDLLEEGWGGLALLAGPRVLDRLRRAGGRRRPARDLYVRLVYGRGYREEARYGRETGLPLCAVNDAWCLDPADLEVGNLLQAMARNIRLDGLPAADRLADRHRLVPDADMERFFSAVPEALENARRLAERASCEGILSRPFVFPRFDGLPEEESCRRLQALCLAGLERRYPDPRAGGSPALQAGRASPFPPAAAARERLDHELAIIRHKGFAGYFLVVHDIVSRCPRTCGRGSSAASIVSYLLGITHVDPLRYNLFFERFLNMERQDPPDIDVDFPWDEREKALRYVFQRYAGHAGMVADHVTFRDRSSLREPAKALGFNPQEIDRFIRFDRYGEEERIPAPLARVARRIRGFPRYLGTHPGGVVVTPRPITWYTHLQDSPLGVPVIAWEKDGAEDAGLVKIDLLGNRSLGVLRDILTRVNGRDAGGNGRGGPHPGCGPLTWEGLDPLEDPQTRRLIAGSGTLGVFYVESPATRQLLAKMRTGDFENLVIASSIIRPAANRYIQEFVRRLQGASYPPLHPALEETLKETYGIMVYQEDVSRVAIDLAGFSPGEADRLRKVLTKKDRDLRLAAFREKFFAGGAGRGVPPQALEKIWEMILSFDGYSFCKAHSASYALVSFKLAWLKRWHPLEFFVAVINNGGGYYTRQTYVNECRRAGFPVLPPDINRSHWEYSAEPAGPAGRPAAMRVGLGQLREIGREFVERLLAEREERGPFADLPDFLRRVSPGLPEMRILIRSGALDSIAGGLTRPQLFWAFFRSERGAGSGALFLCPPVPSWIGDYPPARKLLDEVRTLGLLVSRHPLSVFRRRVLRVARQEGFRRLVSSGQIPALAGRRVSLAGLLVTGKEVTTRKREPMIFVSFEDEQSVYETVFFPRAFRRFYPVIDGGGVFLLSGRVENDLGACSVHVDRIVRISREDGVEGRSARDSPFSAPGGAPAGLPAPAGPPAKASGPARRTGAAAGGPRPDRERPARLSAGGR